LLLRTKSGSLGPSSDQNGAHDVGNNRVWTGEPTGPRRYSAEPVLDDEALMGRLRYVLAHGVKEGLVEKSAEWPGLTSHAYRSY
jgi:hypothetical protein